MTPLSLRGRTYTRSVAIFRKEIRRTDRTGHFATGTLACSACDAPVALAGKALPVTAPLSCPFCLNEGVVRDFLSLADPVRPAVVSIRVR